MNGQVSTPALESSAAYLSSHDLLTQLVLIGLEALLQGDKLRLALCSLSLQLPVCKQKKSNSRFAASACSVYSQTSTIPAAFNVLLQLGKGTILDSRSAA